METAVAHVSLMQFQWEMRCIILSIKSMHENISVSDGIKLINTLVVWHKL